MRFDLRENPGFLAMSFDRSQAVMVLQLLIGLYAHFSELCL
jgi:hypothetical protein